MARYTPEYVALGMPDWRSRKNSISSCLRSDPLNVRWRLISFLARKPPPPSQQFGGLARLSCAIGLLLDLLRFPIRELRSAVRNSRIESPPEYTSRPQYPPREARNAYSRTDKSVEP